MSFEEEIEWVLKNRNHPLIKELSEATKTTDGDLRSGIQLAIGIVVKYLSELPKPDMPSFNDLNSG